jgi:predicted O-methyltransferase YrrM
LESLELSPPALRVAFTLEEHRWIFDRLLQLIREHLAEGYCGNVFFHHISDPYCLELVPKQLNLFQAARHATRALEVGFNAGHSAAIMLLANPRLTIRAFDVGGAAYLRPCLAFLNEVFQQRITLVQGLSQVTLAEEQSDGYDLVHIDGDHTYDAVSSDLALSLPKCSPGAIVIMDDYDEPNDVARATNERADLVRTHEFTMRDVFPGSSHALYRYRAINRG